MDKRLKTLASTLAVALVFGLVTAKVEQTKRVAPLAGASAGLVTVLASQIKWKRRKSSFLPNDKSTAYIKVKEAYAFLRKQQHLAAASECLEIARNIFQKAKQTEAEGLKGIMQIAEEVSKTFPQDLQNLAAILQRVIESQKNTVNDLPEEKLADPQQWEFLLRQVILGIDFDYELQESAAAPTTQSLRQRATTLFFTLLYMDKVLMRYWRNKHPEKEVEALEFSPIMMEFAVLVQELDRIKQRYEDVHWREYSAIQIVSAFLRAAIEHEIFSLYEEHVVELQNAISLREFDQMERLTGVVAPRVELQKAALYNRILVSSVQRLELKDLLPS